jgi:hypothetical protein
MRAMPLAVALTGFVTASPLGAQTTAFVHDTLRVPVGTVSEYVKSNLDGTQAIRVLTWLGAHHRLEVLKLEPENGSAAFVTAEMDWEIASADRLESAVLFPDGTRRPQAVLTLDPSSRHVRAEVFGLRDSLTVGALPIHVYNFDFLSLAAALPHLTRPDAGFTIGVMNPTFQMEPPLLRYDGEARFEPAGLETRDGVRARRYVVEGAGLSGTRIWTAEGDGRLLAIESPVPDNPGWSSFRLELRSTTVRTAAEWAAFVEAEVAALATDATGASGEGGR